MAFAESFSLYFRDFGVDATLNGAAVRGYFRAAGQDSSSMGFGNGGLDSLNPTFQMPSSQAPTSALGQTLAIPGQGSWKVASVDPDGTGISLLRLERP